MANPGGLGSKFVSVNLNKSYGPASHHHSSFGSSSSGQAAASRVRPGGHGGGGGGMVVLSRPRSSQKSGAKLSVPPPLNLPSMRKEHEIFDISGSGGGSAGTGGSGSVSRPTSSGIGWTKPGAFALQDKDGRSGGDIHCNDQGIQVVNAGTKGASAYTPFSARSGGTGIQGSVSAPSAVKTPVLRGEDFPLLQAALPSTSSGPVSRQKDGLQKTHKHVAGEDLLTELTDSSHPKSLVDMRPQGRSSNYSFVNGSNENSGIHRLGSSHSVEQVRKQEEYFPAPLPFVHLTPRSDWADDERDTGNRFAGRDRDHGFPKSKAYWDGEFDVPRSSILPAKPGHTLHGRWGCREDVKGKVPLSEVPKADPSQRDIGPPSREVNLQRTIPLLKEGSHAQEIANDRNGAGERPMGLNRETGKDSKYVTPHFGDTARDGSFMINRESLSRRKDARFAQEGRYQWNHMVESFQNGTKRTTRDRYGNEQSNRHHGDALQNIPVPKSSFSMGDKWLHLNDSRLNFTREKPPFSKGDRPYMDDPFPKDYGIASYDEGDPLSGGIVGVIKRKKDVKQTDFHDPVRESFEAEIEREQQMQEQKRRRIIEEQERAMEQAQREEEERQRMIKEEEERRRRLEEEAQEAAWREEQGRLEAIRRAEEQRIAREEEKRRILVEEERRKEAAKQKLLELESRMAERQAEASKGYTLAAVADEKDSAMVKEKAVYRTQDADHWEDSERMVDRITTSAHSESSSENRSYDMYSRPQPSFREGYSGVSDRPKPSNSWRRDLVEDGSSSSFLINDEENGHHSPRQNTSSMERAFPRKESHGRISYMSSRTTSGGGIEDSQSEVFNRMKDHRWSSSTSGDPYSRNTEIGSEFVENFAERYGDGWGQGQFRANPPRSSFVERLSPETDELYSYTRSRYPLRQPHVLLPPSLESIRKTSFSGHNERPSPPNFADNDEHYNHASRSEPTMQMGYYSAQQEMCEASVDVQTQNAITQEQKLGKCTIPRCDSQSSLSVSSPPDSPVHLSHDDLDESGDSPLMSAITEGKEIPLSANESLLLNEKFGRENHVPALHSVSAAGDEDWTLEDDRELLEQEEYDEDEDGYHEEEEIHEGDDEQIDLTQEFVDLHLEDRGSSLIMDNLVLGFNDGVEVGIPSDEFERNSKNEESIFGIPEVQVPEQGLVDRMEEMGQNLQPVNGLPLMDADGSSRLIEETETANQDSVTQPVDDTVRLSPTSDMVNSLDGSSSSGICVQAAVSSSGQAFLSSAVPTGSSQADLPAKLQFGLFSGTPLIPSPVPAIQIGSIQMPLHLHPPVGPTLSHVHSSQPPLFQFGRMRYASPISQGILPTAPQSVSYVQPSGQAHYNVNQSSGGLLPIEPGQEKSSHNVIKNNMHLVPMDGESTGNNAQLQKGRAEISDLGINKVKLETGSLIEGERHLDLGAKKISASLKETVTEGSLQTVQLPPLSISNGKESSGLKAQGSLSGTKGKRFGYSVRNSGSRSSYPASEASRSDSSGFRRRARRTVQRTEFQVWENVDRKQSSGLSSSNNSGPDDDKSNFTGRTVHAYVKSGSKKGLTSNRPVKRTIVSESSSSGPISSQGPDSASRLDKKTEKESTVVQRFTCSGDGNLKRNTSSEEDEDAPLQSGIVHVFKQPGIEAPSDEDDFIEVRSKRQMLNVRREQREKEIKAKSRAPKAPWKPRSTCQSAVSAISKKNSTSVGSEISNNSHSDFGVSEGKGLANVEGSAGLTNIISPPLAPIGTPAVSSDVQADKRAHNVKSVQTGPASVMSAGGEHLRSGLVFESKSKILDSIQTSLPSWSNPRVNQQVLSLTQTQLDDAMKPSRYETSVTSVGDRGNSVSEPTMPPSTKLTKDKTFSSAANPINSLLAGEKIQFGAVTSPSILPPSNRVVKHGNGAPGSSRPDIQISQNMSAAKNDCAVFFTKDKHPNESCTNLDDCEAEAEAAASAVAVAAISIDEIVGTGLGTHSVSVSDSKCFGVAHIDGLAVDQPLEGQARAEDSLSVSLPADLSVETLPISLWPALPSPQNSPSQLLPHFPGGPPSHFAFFEMNPMLGGPIFALGRHDESAASQQSQKGNSSGSAPIGTWQQCHSGVDSFYGPPAGFTGPFISPSGGIPSVQGPPHMVVYNHFAPVGQFGQVGLSFMGTTYIPSGKQPDWKHNPASSAGIGEGDVNLVSAQRNPPSMATHVQHLAPGSPLLPMASPWAMFDAAPFQLHKNSPPAAPDMSVQGRGSHIPSSSLHSLPPSLPLQQHESSGPPSQFTHGPHVDPSLPGSRYDSQTLTPSDSSQSFSMATEKTASQFHDKLELVDSSNLSVAGASTQRATNKSSGSAAIADSGKTSVIHNDGNNSNDQRMNAFKVQSSQQKNLTQQYSPSAGYNHQRVGLSQKKSTGGEWAHRRMGFHGRNQSLGAEKSYPSKIKQIYVAKQSMNQNSTAG